MPRPMRLTSPNLRGSDVKSYQNALRRRLKSRRPSAMPTADGVYGHDTHDASRTSFYLLGGLDLDDAKRRERINRFPGLRAPTELVRARKRMKDEKARQQRAGGLKRALDWARDQVGTKEHPAGSNSGPKITDWLKRVGIGAAPWCGGFAAAVADVYGRPVTDETRYCPSIEAHARRGSGGYERYTTDPLTAKRALDDGHLVFTLFHFGSGIAKHVGVLLGLVPGGVRNVEGNTSSTAGGSQDNGGTVAIRERTTSQVKGFAIVRKPA